MRSSRFLFFNIVLIVNFFLIVSNLAFSQNRITCPDENTCSPDPSNPSYSSLITARSQKQNARGSRSPIFPHLSTPAHSAVIPGSQSYSYVMPILNLPGRNGLDLVLNLYYNSRVWEVDASNPSQPSISFDADRDFPSYGFRLDFGYLEANTQAPFILTDSDGTKHAFAGTGTSFDSTDGTLIHYDSAGHVITYATGSTVQYEAFPTEANLYRPIKIKDTNGNFILITYVPGAGNDQHISTITDTLGRVITFNYNASNQLSSITQNDVDPTGVHTYATFSWASLYGAGYAWYNFSSSASVVAPALSSSLNVLTKCTYANQVAYRFTYGDWAIINKIENLSANGTVRSYTSYDYPTAGQGALSDAPAYTKQTVSPDGLTTNLSSWTYGFTKSGTGSVTSVVITDLLNNAFTSNLNTDGTLSSLVNTDGSGHILNSVGYTWKTVGASVRPDVVTTTNDASQQSSIQYFYDTNGNITDLYERDFTGANVRHTVTTYKQTPFTTQHILNLPASVTVKNGSDVIIARTDFDYDTTTISPTIGGLATHDDSIGSTRGNLTSVTRYTDPVTPSGGIARTFTYDSLGNLRTAQMDCCNQKTFSFSSLTQYAYPDSVVRGSSPQFTSSFTYNFDTGNLKTSTDENGQQTQYQYNDPLYRLTATLPPPSNGTTVQYNVAFDDTSASPAVTQSSTVNSAVVIQTFDGLGHLIEQDTSNGSVISSVKRIYDKLWRQSQVSNPYAPGETPVYTTFGYDGLGRVTSIAPPSGGSTVITPLGNTTTITDPAGKTRKNYFDALGRLTQVDEPGVVSDHIPANNYLNLQSGGNVVLFDPYNNPLWSTGTTGTGYGPLELQDDGNLTLYQFKWQIGTYRAWNGAKVPYDSCFVGSELFAGQIVNNGQCLENTSNTTFAYMDNGNLEIYDRQLSQITWQSNTYGNPGAYLTMRTDGNLVIYSSGGVVLWSSGTNGSGANVAELEDDGRLILYSTVWNTGTSQGQVSGSLTAPSCNLGSALGSTGTMGTGQCLVSCNGHFQLLLQSDGNLVLSKIDVTPAQVLWSTGTALTPLSLDVAFHTTYSYDPLDNLTGVSQGNITGQSGSGQSRSYLYDSLGRLTTSTTPESGTVNTYYTDASGAACSGDPMLPCRIVDARSITKNLSYDGINRLQGVTYTNDPSGTAAVTYQYDFGGQAAFSLDRLTKITEGANTQTFTYDNLGRIATVTNVFDGVSYPLSYAYNPADQVSSVTYPSGRIVSQNYDSVGRTQSIVSAGTTYLNVVNTATDYNAAGQIKAVTYGNGVQGAFTYNDHLQLATLRYFKTGVASDVLNLSYDYTTGVPGNNGQIQAVHYYTSPDVEDTTKSEYFTYDSLSRLSAAQTGTVNSTPGTWSLVWGYDRFGNRLSQSLMGGNVSIGQPNFTVNPATNRITNSGYTYDAAGNMTHDADTSYGFDGANRLISANNGSTPATYTYFGALRTKKVVGSVTTVTIYSGTKPIAEYMNAALSKEYIYGGSNLLTTISGGVATYHHPDQLSNRAETDFNGDVIRTYGHFPFGETWYETGTPDKWKFTSYARDTGETNLDYAKFRHYGSLLGRFASPDLLAGSLEAPQSLNRYTNVLNDPLNLTDPLGLDPCEIMPGAFCFRKNVWEPGPGGGGGSGTSAATEQPGPTDNGGSGVRGPAVPTTASRFFNCLQGLLNLPGQHTISDAVAATGRANNNQDTMEDAAGDDWPILAAIGVRETYFRNINQYGGLLGRGIFQIDIGQNPQVSEAEAKDPTFAANWVWDKLSNDMTKYRLSPANLSANTLPEAIHDYNASPFTHGGTLSQSLKGIPGLDRFTAGHNYVSNVLNLVNCFQLGLSMNLPKLTF